VPPLLIPPHELGDGAQGPLPEGIWGLGRARQKKDLLLDGGRQLQQAQELAQPRSRDMPRSGDCGTVVHLPLLQPPFELDRQGQQLGNPRDALGRGWPLGGGRGLLTTRRGRLAGGA